MPDEAPKTEAAHAGIHGWDGDGLEAGEKVLTHWPTHPGHLVLTDRHLLRLTHPHALSLKLEASWSTALEEIEVLEVVQAEAITSALHTASISTGSMPMKQSGGSSPGAIGVQDAKLAGSFELVVDQVVVYKGNPGPAQELQEKIDRARTDRLVALGRMARGPPKT